MPGQPAEQLFQLRAVILWPVKRHEQGLFDPELARKVRAACLLERGPVSIEQKPIELPHGYRVFTAVLEEMLDLTEYAARDAADAHKQGGRREVLDILRRDRPTARP